MRLRAVVEAAAAFAAAAATGGNYEMLLDATNGVFARAAAPGSTNEIVSRGWLLLAQAKFVQGTFRRWPRP